MTCNSRVSATKTSEKRQSRAGRYRVAHEPAEHRRLRSKRVSLMKLRTLLFANAALLACAGTVLSSPAFAGEGWYVGLGAGWDQLNNPKIEGDGLDGKL